MIKLILCGINDHTVVQIHTLENGILVSNSQSNNSEYGKADIQKSIMLGIYKNQLIPVLVDDNGRLIL